MAHKSRLRAFFGHDIWEVERPCYRWYKSKATVSYFFILTFGEEEVISLTREIFHYLERKVDTGRDELESAVVLLWRLVKKLSFISVQFLYDSMLYIKPSQTCRGFSDVFLTFLLTWQQTPMSLPSTKSLIFTSSNAKVLIFFTVKHSSVDEIPSVLNAQNVSLYYEQSISE